MKKINLAILTIAAAFLAYGFMSSEPQTEGKKEAPAKAAPSKVQITNGKAETQTGLNIGDIAPDITYSNPEGKPISLYSLRGKMVLLDFWASWCRPCRMENPNVVTAYNKYKSNNFKNGKGFTILGVSLDMNKDAWMKAIMDDNLTWDHISDLGYWNSAPASIYGVHSIPTNFLIDGSGKIIGISLRGAALEDALEKEKVAK